MVDLADALFFVALVRVAGFLRAAAARVLVAFLVEVFLRRRVRRGALSASDAPPRSRSMPKTDDIATLRGARGPLSTLTARVARGAD